MMKKVYLSILAAILLSSLMPSVNVIAEGTNPDEEPESGAVGGDQSTTGV